MNLFSSYQISWGCDMVAFSLGEVLDEAWAVFSEASPRG